MSNNNSYFGSAIAGLKTLLTGMDITMGEFVTPKVTEQYPENRKTQHIAERHRGTLVMPHDAEGKNKCIACTLCEKACPNGSIKIVSQMVTSADGKKKKLLTDYQYDLGDCMFCQLCVNACPHDAIKFVKDFENSVFNRDVLKQHLNIPPTKEEMEQYAKNAEAAAKAAAEKKAADEKAAAEKKAAEATQAAKPAAKEAPKAASAKPDMLDAFSDINIGSK